MKHVNTKSTTTTRLQNFFPLLWLYLVIFPKITQAVKDQPFDANNLVVFKDLFHHQAEPCLNAIEVATRCAIDLSSKQMQQGLLGKPVPSSDSCVETIATSLIPIKATHRTLCLMMMTAAGKVEMNGFTIDFTKSVSEVHSHNEGDDPLALDRRQLLTSKRCQTYLAARNIKFLLSPAGLFKPKHEKALQRLENNLHDDERDHCVGAADSVISQVNAARVEL